MIEYIMSFFITVIQIAAFICFFDIFFDAVSKKKKIIYAAVLTVTAYVVIQQFVYLLGEKRVILQVIFAIFMYLIYTLAVYRQDLSTSLFFVILGYSIFLFVDFTIAGLLPIEYLSEWKDYYDVLIILSYIPVFIMFRLMRAGLSRMKSHIGKASSLWSRFGWIPVITFIIGVYLFYVSFREGKLGFAYTVLGIGIMLLDIVFLFMLQGVLVREEEISLVKIREQKNQNQMHAFNDMKSLYDRQSKKLHDYRKQLVTLRELVQQGEKDTAIAFIDELTESISVEISEVNVGHPVINAVLNQTYRVAKGKNIAISLTVGDLHGVMMDGEDIVIVLGNLLENAVNECEKLAGSDRPAVIGVKMVEKGSGFMLTVRNPVREKVEITDNKVQSEPSDGHGIGLLNVEKTVRKY
ncbi:MAG: GHKL domain-containing protein, partial [Lachnospiraceae bacterium]|nr:GHKL domain-containing protein [Lachnospiraceae bacterium]